MDPLPQPDLGPVCDSGGAHRWGRACKRCVASRLGQSICKLSWSPDQQQVACDEGNDFLSNSGAASTGAASRYLLQLGTDKIQTILIPPGTPADFNSPTSSVVEGYFPPCWIDNTRLYLREFDRCCGRDDSSRAGLYLLANSQGIIQPVSDMQMIAMLDGGSFEGIALSPGRSKLYLSKCSYGLAAGGGTWAAYGTIHHRGDPSTIYTDSTAAIASMVILSQNTLLVLLESYRQGWSQ